MADATCTGPCKRELPPSAFAKDARLRSGHRAVCKVCDRAATRARRGDTRAPGGLVLVGNFPEPPPVDAATAIVDAVFGGARPARPQSPSTYADAAEATIAALVPPAGPADALLVRALRGLSELLDVYSNGQQLDVVKDTTALVAKVLAVQGALAATRATKKDAPAKPEAAGRLASGQF